MWLLILTVASGLVGAALQHYLPRVMTAEVPLETIYDEIDHVRLLLREEADRRVEALCGNLGFVKSSVEGNRRAGGFTSLRPIAAAAAPLRTSAAVSAGASAAVATAPESIRLSQDESAPLRLFYLNEMRLFLEPPRKHRHRLAQAATASGTFAGLRTLLPSRAHAAARRPRRHLRGSPPTGTPREAAPLAARLAAAAHSAFACADFARRRTCGHGLALLNKW